MKTCPRCKKSKPLQDFAKAKNRADGVQMYCRECKRSMDKALYYREGSDRKQRILENRQAVVQENRQRVWDFLKAHPCVDCQEPDPVVLEFDHVRGRKTREISRMVNYSWATIQKEIAKCVVRCANCHRKRTAQQMGWYAGIA